jgi:hypothetical protein
MKELITFIKKYIENMWKGLLIMSIGIEIINILMNWLEIGKGTECLPWPLTEENTPSFFGMIGKFVRTNLETYWILIKEMYNTIYMYIKQMPEINLVNLIVMMLIIIWIITKIADKYMYAVNNGQTLRKILLAIQVTEGVARQKDFIRYELKNLYLYKKAQDKYIWKDITYEILYFVMILQVLNWYLINLIIESILIFYYAIIIGVEGILVTNLDLSILLYVVTEIIKILILPLIPIMIVIYCIILYIYKIGKEEEEIKRENEKAEKALVKETLEEYNMILYYIKERDNVTWYIKKKLFYEIKWNGSIQK